MSHAFARGQTGFDFPLGLAAVFGVREPKLGELALEFLGILPAFFAQYEARPARAHANLQPPLADARGHGLIVITGEASCAAAKAGITRSAQGSSTFNQVSNQMTVKKPADTGSPPPQP